MNAGGLLADHLAHYLPSRVFALDAAHLAGRPTALVNYSFAVTRPDLLSWAAPVLREVSVHAVRETLSRDRLVSIGVAPERISVVPDAAFAADLPPVAKKTPGRPVIAIQVRGDRQADIAAWTALINLLRSQFNARIVYLCGCRKHDPPVRTALECATGLDLAGEDGDLEALRASIGQAQLLVSDRYHGAVFATQMGTPFVPLAPTTHKTAGFIADLGYATPVYPPLSPGGIEGVIAAVGALLSCRENTADALQAKAQNLRSRLFGDYHSLITSLLSTQHMSRPLPE
jgi:polysaccharide pyruvyl transferase WcaK-like protein